MNARDLNLLERLHRHYGAVNRAKFGGVLPPPDIRLNARLRALTGRVFYDHDVIELAAFHLQGEDAWDVAVETLEHEMLHLYLDKKGLPCGHTTLFKKLAAALRITVWHARPYPRRRTSEVQHVYACPCCGRQVVRSRRLSQSQRSACGACCREHGDGTFDARFVMVFVESRSAAA